MYAQLELNARNAPKVKGIFSRCLLNCFSIPLWTAYLDFIKQVGLGAAAEICWSNASGQGSAAWLPVEQFVAACRLLSTGAGSEADLFSISRCQPLVHAAQHQQGPRGAARGAPSLLLHPGAHGAACGLGAPVAGLPRLPEDPPAGDAALRHPLWRPWRASRPGGRPQDDCAQVSSSALEH